MEQHTHSSSNDDSAFFVPQGSVCHMVATAQEKMILENFNSDTKTDITLPFPPATAHITAVDGITLHSPPTTTPDTTIDERPLQSLPSIANDTINAELTMSSPPTHDRTMDEMSLESPPTATRDTPIAELTMSSPPTHDTTISEISLQLSPTINLDTTKTELTMLSPPTHDATIAEIPLQSPPTRTHDTTEAELTMSLPPTHDITMDEISLQSPPTTAHVTPIAELSVPPTQSHDATSSEISIEQSPRIETLDTTIAKIAMSSPPPLIPDSETSTAMSLQPSSSVVVSDDEVQILNITKKEPQARLSIKIDSSDEESIEIKGVLVIPESESEICKDISENIKAVTGSNNAEAGNSPKDSTCSICLSEFDNKAFLDQCFHAFCFYCILQWSEIVRTCPLCKALFTKIIHSVKSMTEYQQHKLPPKENPTKNTTTSSGRRFRYRTTLVNGRLPHNATATSSRPLNAWEQRAERRERLLAMKRRKSIRAKEKRRSIYARNLWVQTVNQTGRPKYRDTSPQFFRANPACTHRLVPWLTRELQCLLNEDKDHVDFVLSLILCLIPKISIESQEFLEQLRPFLLEKTEHFCHEFLSFARSPFDMIAYDGRAQYDWSRFDGEQVERTPMVVDMSATGWDSPDEAQASVVVPYSNEPGPSGLSSQQLNGWPPPITDAIELPINEVWSNIAEQRTNDVVDLSPEVIDLVSPKEISHSNKHKRKHKHRHKHKHGKRVRYSENSEHSPIRLSTSPVQRSSPVDVVILSSSQDSSPEDQLHSRDSNSYRSDDDSHRKSRHRGKQPKQNFHWSSETVKSRDSSSDRSIDEANGRQLRRKGKHSKGAGTRSREKSCELSRDSRKNSRKCRENNKYASRLLSSERDPKSGSISNGCLGDMSSSALSTKPSTPVVARPLSPTEDDMRREILDLEKKIAEDTNRLDELTKKQQQRKLLEMDCFATGSSLHNEDSETDGQSR